MIGCSVAYHATRLGTLAVLAKQVRGERDPVIVIPKELLEAVVAHAWRGAPNEVCGWLAGERNEIRRVYPVPNVADDPRVEFRMDPEIQLSAMREISELGLALNGTYHSHPRTPAVPSARDGGLAAYPEAVHLIVSLAAPEPEVRCYRVKKNVCCRREHNRAEDAIKGGAWLGGEFREMAWSKGAE